MHNTTAAIVPIAIIHSATVNGFYNLAINSNKKADAVSGTQWKPGTFPNINYCWDIAAQSTTPHDFTQCPFVN